MIGVVIFAVTYLSTANGGLKLDLVSAPPAPLPAFYRQWRTETSKFYEFFDTSKV